MSEPVGFENVFEDELRAISERRNQRDRAHPPATTGGFNGQDSAASLRHQPPNSAQNDRDRQLRQNLVGLALSGGGVRSASFNLGMIQALDEHGVFAQIDYLSTVSGGGYFGGYLSSLSLAHPPDTGENEPNRAAANGSTAGSPHEPGRTGRMGETRVPNDDSRVQDHVTRLAPWRRSPQPSRVRKLIYSGDYLRVPLTFLNRYLIGLLLINLFIFSGLIACAAGCAWLFRCLDQTTPRFFLSGLGFGDDVARAFFPALLCGLAWIAAWLISYWRSGTGAAGNVARWILGIFIASLLIGVATLMGNGQISMRRIAQLVKIRLDEQTVDNIRNALKFAVVTPIILFLLPYFRPDRLLKSGMNQNAKWWERIIFKCAGGALLIGVPLLAVGFFARENISNRNETRDGTLTRSDLDWQAFCRRVEGESNALNEKLLGSHQKRPLVFVPELAAEEDLKYLQETLARHRLLSTERLLPDTGRLLAKIREIEDECQETDKTSFLGRWGSFAASILEGKDPDNKFVKLFWGWRDDHYLRMAAMANVNQALRDHTLYTFVERAMPDPTAADKAQQTEGRPSQLLIPPSSTATKEQHEMELRRLLLEAKAVEKEKPNSDTPNSAVISWRNNVTDINRRLLTAYYGEKTVLPKTACTSLVPVIDEDQKYRFAVFYWSSIIFLIGGFTVHLNATSLHGYYRNQLAKTWIENRVGIDRDILLSELNTTAQGYPYHLICATANYIRRQDRKQGSTGHFLFSHLYCGSSRTGYESTGSFAGGNYDLASAMAISGAAVSPAQMNNLFVATLLLLLNFRLGQWLPNPGHTSYVPQWLSRYLVRWPCPFLVAASLVRKSETRAYCLVTDGGHHENLGVEPLLRRCCRLIICSDAGHDPQYQFRDIISLQRQQRLDNGIEICAVDQGVLKLDDILPEKETRISKAEYVTARVDYPTYNREGEGIQRLGAEHGYLIYIKPTFTGTEDFDLAAEMRGNSEFPHDSTADQSYLPEKFDSYRRLGYHIAKRLCEQYFRSVKLTEWDPSVPKKEPCEEVLFIDRPYTVVGDLHKNERQDAASTVDEKVQQRVERLVNEVLEGGDNRPILVNALVDMLLKKGGDKRRQVAAQLLKEHCDVSPRVQSAAIHVSLDGSETSLIRLAAMDLLAATQCDSVEAQQAIELLRLDNDPAIASEAAKLPCSRARSKTSPPRKRRRGTGK